MTFKIKLYFYPDPAPVVSGDRLYVFTGHDLDTATYFRMPDWQLFSITMASPRAAMVSATPCHPERSSSSFNLY